MWPTWTRSNAPWQRTIVRSRSWLRMRARSDSGTIFCFQPSAAGPAPVTGRIGDTRRRSLMASPFERVDQGERAPHVDEILHPERLALALLPFHQLHRHLHIGRRLAQRFDQDFRLEPVAARLDAQALENRGFVNLQAVVIRQPTPRDRVHDEREEL